MSKKPVQVQTATEVAHLAAAERLHAALAPFRGQVAHVQIVFSGAVDMHLGQLEHVLGRLDDAEESFIGGDAVHRRLESPMLIADNHTHWAAMLTDRDASGDRDRAHALATSALEVAIAGGYGYIEARARKVLDRGER